ncbi:MAG: hypothetical protein ACRDQA_10760 [Nocardioidaceae bacterium]
MPDSSLEVPDAQHRWRCAACGNLTRFDVVRTATTREYWHADLSGAARVEDVETTHSAVTSVTCRWCGRDDAIAVVTRPGADQTAAADAAAH